LQTTTGTSSRDNVAAAAPVERKPEPETKIEDKEKSEVESLNDDWDDNDAWGDFGEKDSKAPKALNDNNVASRQKEDDENRRGLFYGDDLNDLDDIPTIDGANDFRKGDGDEKFN